MADQTNAPDPITIDIWTDVVCPWCYIGEGRLQEAIKAEGLEDVVTIQAHSFELDPGAPQVASAESSLDHLVKKLGRSEEELRGMEDQIRGLAAEINLPYSVNRPMANTRAIHRLVQAAAEKGQGNELFRTLQGGYFSGDLDVFDEDVLVTEAAKVGLSEDEARAALDESSSLDEAVQADIGRARQLGATGVPFMLFNHKYAAPGALPLDAYRSALRTLANMDAEEVDNA